MDAKELRIGNYINAPTWGYARDGDNRLILTKVNTISNGWYNVNNESKYGLCINHEFKETGCEWGPSIEIDCKPIPLTEERLLKAGFECKDKVNGGYVKQINYPHQKVYLYCSKNGTVALWDELRNVEILIMKNCKYVHQLQNLYFALTGTELEFK